SGAPPSRLFALTPAPLQVSWCRSESHPAVRTEARGDDVHVAAGAHSLGEPHMCGFLEQRVVEQVADVDEHRAHHRRLPDEDQQWTERNVTEDLASAGEGD